MNAKCATVTDKDTGKVLGKMFKSPGYNYVFDFETGTFLRWGKTKQDDPEWAPYGPEILDIEISTICHKGCSHCYKSNTGHGKNMTLERYKQLFSKFPKSVTQIAFGIGDIDSNPDLWDIMGYTRNNNVVPNITVNGHRVYSGDMDKLAAVCGAVAVSHYDDNECFNTVQGLTSRVGNGGPLRQVNIHKLLSHETWQSCMNLMIASQSDPRLEKLNAIVFLWLKPKGERNDYHQVTLEQYKELVNYALANNIRIGFDSCSAPMFMKAAKDHPEADKMFEMVDACESTLFSYYINVDGIGYPCSFSEGLPQFKGMDVLNCNDFQIDIWCNNETHDFRWKCANSKDENSCRRCTIYELG